MLFLPGKFSFLFYDLLDAYSLIYIYISVWKYLTIGVSETLLGYNEINELGTFEIQHRVLCIKMINQLKRLRNSVKSSGWNISYRVAQSITYYDTVC